MAGMGSRYAKLFPSVPKYKIKYDGKSFFEMTLKTLSTFRDNELIIIVHKSACDEDFIKDVCFSEGYKNYQIITIDTATDGQAGTLKYASNVFLDDVDESFIVYNIDTFFSPEFVLDIPYDAKGYIPVVKSNQSNLSFVKFDSQNVVSDIKEKVKISEYGSIGLYYFSTWAEFERLYDTYRQEILFQYGETYIAPFYTYLINTRKVYTQVLPRDAVHFLGTEEEYRNHQHDNINIFP